MNIERYPARVRALWSFAAVLLVLIAANLACERAGEILTPAEATARAAEATARAREVNIAPTATPRPTSEGGEQEQETPQAPEGPQVGDTAYLAGKGYLIRLVDKPGGMKMIAGQEKGVEIKIVNMTEYEGETWYLVDAPTGEGWVPAENVSAEKP